MSEAARLEREHKRHWAEPGGRHDQFVGAAKKGLPVIGGLLLLALLFVPFTETGDVSFILDEKEVDQAPERMRVERARYTGEDNKGQQFEIIAKRAIQPTSRVPIVKISGMSATLQLARGPLTIAADQGMYDLDNEQVKVNGPLKVSGPDGYMLETRDVTVDLDKRRLWSDGAVTGAMRLGTFRATGLEADLGERTITLEGRATLKIVQGAVR